MKNILLLLALVLSSCYNNIEFIIENNSGKKIDSLIIKSNNNHVFLKDLNNKNSAALFLEFKNKEPRGDGSYMIEIYEKKKLINLLNFGYTDNGIPMESSLFIEIFKDSISINKQK